MNRVPEHVSIIMDGNGRWAEQQGRERTFGHQMGAKSVRAVAEECVRQGVKYLSLYAFSEENWNRPKEEVGFLMALLAKSIKEEINTLLKNGVRLRVLGNRGRLDKSLLAAIASVEKATAANDRLELIVFLSYSGKWDIMQAVKRLALEKTPSEIQAMTLDDFDGWLVTAGVPDPDLIIRTSGEQRVSNYLLWQGAYSEYYFTPVLWPDFREEQLRQALEEYARRDRRYGNVK